MGLEPYGFIGQPNFLPLDNSEILATDHVFSFLSQRFKDADCRIFWSGYGMPYIEIMNEAGITTETGITTDARIFIDWKVSTALLKYVKEKEDMEEIRRRTNVESTHS